MRSATQQEVDENDALDKAKRQITTLRQLQSQIQKLASVEMTDAFFVSCYLNIKPGGFSWREELERKSALFRRTLKGAALLQFEDNIEKIKQWLTDHLLPTSRGVAIFARGGEEGTFWLPMQFSAPLPNIMTLYPTPYLYHLIELKDTYHSYILLIAKKDCAYILEVNLGEATIQAWIENPELFKQVGTEWSRLYYQVNKVNRGKKYHEEKINIIRHLMHQNALSHLVLAGDPEVINPFKYHLPIDLKKRLVDAIPAMEHDQPLDIVKATLSSFIDYEEQESQEIADKLVQQLNGQNLAVAGTNDTFDALLWGEVDTLVMSSQYDPDPGWRCKDCKHIGINKPHVDVCPICDKQSIQPIDLKEAILRLASQQDIFIEVVDHSDSLMAVGGVGCLLRYKKSNLEQKVIIKVH